MPQCLCSQDVVKRYAGVVALSSGSLKAIGGEVVALIGANGSGKSTLCKVITGVVAPDGGQLLLNDHPLTFATPHEALQLGIAAVYQDLSLVPSMTVAQNIWLTREPMKGFLLDRTEMRHRSKELLDLFKGTVRPGLTPETLVADLPPDEQQIVEILKAFSTDPKVMIMDEATSSLDNRQVKRLFELVAAWKEEDRAIIFISHRMSEVFQVSDRITVLRNGKTVGDFVTGEVNEEKLVHLMAAEAKLHIRKSTQDRSVDQEKIFLKVQKLCTDQLRSVDFNLYHGELLGIGGLQGQGQSDILHSIFGSIPYTGVIAVDGIEQRFRHPSEAMEQGIALVPGDRAREGLLMRSSILENLMLPNWMKYGFPLRLRQARKAAGDVTRSLQVVMSGQQMLVSSLSGGNAQKIVIGKWLQRNPRLLMLNDPTKGVDVGAKAEFYDLLMDLLQKGTSILFYSSDDEELIGLCDRILVMGDGMICKELRGDELNLKSLVRASLSISEGDSE